MSCHTSCLTCLTTSFTSCLTCKPSLSLISGTCNCQSPWQVDCTGQSQLRQLIQFLDLFLKLYIITLMLLYILKIKLPLSYRIWSGLNGLSLLVYNAVFYLQYEDQLCLRALAVSNGPYFATYRVMQLSTSHIFPTMVVFIVVIALVVLFYYPFCIFTQPSESVADYLKNSLLHFFDCAYFFTSKMMFFYIGKFIAEISTASALYIAIVAVYGLIILLTWIRLIYKYHKDTIDTFSYDSPLYIYTMLSPVSYIGLALAPSSTLLLIIYCVPIGLLLLILILNRSITIFTKPNIWFFVVELLMIGLSIAFILLNDQIRTYVIVGIMIASVLGVTVQVGIRLYGGVEFSVNKVHPVLEQDYQDDRPPPKKILGEEKDGYF